MIENNEQQIALTYSFDNYSQAKLFKKSIETLDHKIDIVLLVSKTVFDYDVVQEVIESYEGKITLLAVERPETKGMFYWLLSPLMTNYKYLIQCDNDLLFKGVDFNVLINNYKKKLNKKVFLGVKGHFWRVEKNKIIVKSQRKNYFDYLLKLNKYINTGFVLINTERFKSKYDYDLIDELMSKFTNDMVKNNWKITDQEFLTIYFYNEIGFIANKYNLRINNLFYLRKYYRKSSIIYHYNLWRTIEGINTKFDFINQFDEVSNDELADKITNYWAIGKKRPNKKIYRKAILDMLEVSNKKD